MCRITRFADLYNTKRNNRNSTILTLQNHLKLAVTRPRFTDHMIWFLYIPAVLILVINPHAKFLVATINKNLKYKMGKNPNGKN